jgi:altronate dehydratase
MEIRAEIHLHVHDGDGERVLALLHQLLHNQGKIMATLDEVLADVTDEGTQIDSLSVLVAGLKQQLADALSGTTLPPAVQAKVDAVFAGDDAINANTPAAAGP